MKPTNDIFYAMSHGVNRATLKVGKLDERVFFLKNLIKSVGIGSSVPLKAYALYMYPVLTILILFLSLILFASYQILDQLKLIVHLTL